jgi:hypothetical protein
MKQQFIYTCEEIQTGEASRSYSGTKLYTIKGACQNQVDKMNSYSWRHGKLQYELVTYELLRLKP